MRFTADDAYHASIDGDPIMITNDAAEQIRAQRHSAIRELANALVACPLIGQGGHYTQATVQAFELINTLRNAAEAEAMELLRESSAEPESLAMKIETPCPHCGREEDGQWVTPCPSDDCPSDDE